MFFYLNSFEKQQIKAVPAPHQPLNLFNSLPLPLGWVKVDWLRCFDFLYSQPLPLSFKDGARFHAVQFVVLLCHPFLESRLKGLKEAMILSYSL